MKKSKKSTEEPRDRLSELPDSLIYEIFWFFPMRDVVRTTVLSKQWNNLWTTAPYLNFDRHAPEFVNRALLLRRGFGILKFKFGRCFNKSVFSDIDVWVRLAKENGIQELYLEDIFIFNNDAGDMYCVLHNLFSCSSLKVLSLKSCSLQIHGNVQWNQLKCLRIEECDMTGMDEHWMNQVVSGSPQLEVFILSIWGSDKNLSIRSSSLKKLSITRHFKNDDELLPVSELRIWSPNLETLDILGQPYGKCLFMNVSSLTHLTLEVSSQTSEEDISVETLWQTFPSIQHVQKGLGDMKEKYLLSPLLNVKFLKIISYDTQYKELMDLLHIFPKLETLVLQCNDCSSNLTNYDTRFLQVERNLPESFLLQLRTVEITLGYDVDDLMFFHL